MARQNNNRSGLRICIALRSKTNDPLEFGRMLYQTISDLGFSPVLAEDGERDALEADVLLLVSDCYSFDGYAELMSKPNEPRPRTILLQIGPLPWPTLGISAEQIGCKAISNLNKWEQSWRSKLLNSLLTRSLRRKVKQMVYAGLFRDFKEEIADGSKPFLNQLDEESYKFMMREYVWLKNQFPQGWLDYVFCTTPTRKEFLLKRGIPAQYAPLGYHPIMGEDWDMERDIGVLLIGNLKNSRRRIILSRIGEILASKGIQLHTKARNCLGAERTKMLNRARISLNIAQFPWEVAGLRFLMSMACGALVVSEYLENPAPYKPGVHFVHARVSDLPDVIEHYLEHPAETESIVRSAQQFITQELTLKKTISQILEGCNLCRKVSAKKV